MTARTEGPGVTKLWEAHRRGHMGDDLAILMREYQSERDDLLAAFYEAVTSNTKEGEEVFELAYLREVYSFGGDTTFGAQLRRCRLSMDLSYDDARLAIASWDVPLKRGVLRAVENNMTPLTALPLSFWPALAEVLLVSPAALAAALRHHLLDLDGLAGEGCDSDAYLGRAREALELPVWAFG